MKDFGIIQSRMEKTRDSLRKVITNIDLEIKVARGKSDIFFSEINKWSAKITKIQEAPLEIKQVMMNDYERTNFGTIKARVDRCMTCHLGWREGEVMADAPQPFTSHPFPELLEKHNPEIFGCTTCHQGQGPALDAGFAHSKHAAKDADPYFEKHLLENNEVYASCQSCHSNEVYLKNAKPFNKSRQLLIEQGCFGCHEVKGYNDMMKIGPELNQLSAKTTPEWLFRWVRNPKDYNPHTRMPNFKFSADSAEAITAYLMDLSKENTFQTAKNAFVGGSAERGKQVVNEVGCKGCHVIDNDERVRTMRGTSYDIAPELTRIGSKTNPDWLYDWVRNPKHFQSDTRMPNLRLTDTEAKDVVAYLMTMKDDRRFEEHQLDLSSAEKIKFGEKLVREYGCHGCHAIRGMEKEGKVSVSLSNFGRKRVDELDFGDTHVHHSWDEWVFGKIHDARQYTTERITSKMPVFSLADSEIVSLRTLLRGMSKDTAEAEYNERVTPQLLQIQAGRKFTIQYNCIGCHNLEDNGGYVKALFEDAGFAPPPITGEGAKVQELWLHSFLTSPTPIRPWLKLRMPTFGFSDTAINTVTKYFLGVSKKEMEVHDYTAVKPNPELLPTGKILFELNQCLSCHYTGTIPAGKEPSDLAPNLSLAHNRLKPEWVIDWLSDPEKIQQGTRMPQFFPDGQAIYTEYLNGDALKQKMAIRDCLDVWK